MKIEIKNRNSNLHLDYLEMVLLSSEKVKAHKSSLKQIVVKEDSVLLKNTKGKYITNLSLKELEKNFNQKVGL